MSETTTVPPPAHFTALGQIIAEIVAPAAAVGFYDRDGQITAAHYQYWRSLSGGHQ